MTNSPSLYHHQKLHGLDHLRAFAISFVLLFHFRLFHHPQWIDSIGKFGWTGVDLFFVLSGFLISSELFKESSKSGTISLKRFFAKRSFRILPPYLLVVAIYFLIPGFREREALPPLWRFLTFTQDFGLDLQAKGTFSHAWSLCVEEQFYLLLPLALLLVFRFKLAKRGIFILTGLILLGFCCRVFSWYHYVLPYVNADDFTIYWYKYIYYPSYNRLDGLIIGVSISALFHFKPKAAAQITRYQTWLFPAVLVVLICTYFVCGDAHSFSATILCFPMIAFGYGLLVLWAIIPGTVMYRYKLWLTEKLAGLSYGIYLIHKGIIHLTQQYFGSLGIPADSNRMFLICLFFIVLGALLLNFAVEKPVLKLRKRIIDRAD